MAKRPSKPRVERRPPLKVLVAESPRIVVDDVPPTFRVAYPPNQYIAEVVEKALARYVAPSKPSKVPDQLPVASRVRVPAVLVKPLPTKSEMASPPILMAPPVMVRPLDEFSPAVLTPWKKVEVPVVFRTSRLPAIVVEVPVPEPAMYTLPWIAS